VPKVRATRLSLMIMENTMSIDPAAVMVERP